VLHWILWHSLSLFCWSHDLSICFLHFPLVPVLIYYWGETGFPFFHLPIFALAIVTVLVLCAIKYFLACNNNNGDIWNGRLRGEGKQECKEKGKNKQTSKKKTVSKKQGEIVY
jgi:hypothetical protein